MALPLLCETKCPAAGRPGGERLVTGSRANVRRCQQGKTVKGENPRVKNGLRTSTSLTDSIGLSHSLLEVLVASGGSNVFNSYVNSLLDNSVTNTLVELNTNGTRGNVPHNTGLSVVLLVGHSLQRLSSCLVVAYLLFITSSNDIYTLAELEGSQVDRGRKLTITSELTSESLSGTSTITVRVRHRDWLGG